MDYSLYILYGNETATEEDFIGDTGLLEHVGVAAMGALTDVIDLDLYDNYASKLKSDDSVALRGSMITDMKFNTEVTTITKYSWGSSDIEKFVQSKITVKGRLYMPLAVGTMNRRKNMAKVLMWANTPRPKAPAQGAGGGGGGGGLLQAAANAVGVGGADPNKVPDDLAENYYRKVIATIYSTTDKQFRAVIFNKAFVDSYEESYNSTDGDGTFTLVIKERVDKVEDVKVQGPTYEISKVSVISQIADTANSLSSKTSKVVETVEKFTGETEVTKKIKDITGSIETAHTTFKSTVIEGDLSIDNVSDKVDEHTDDVQENYTDVSLDRKIDDAKKAAEYNEEYEKLSDEQKKILKEVPGFDKLSTDEKMEYIEKISEKNDINDKDLSIDKKLENAQKYMKAYKGLNDEQKAILKEVPGFDKLSTDEKMEYIDKLTSEDNDNKDSDSDDKDE